MKVAGQAPGTTRTALARRLHAARVGGATERCDLEDAGELEAPDRDPGRGETPEAQRRIVLRLYAILGPVFGASLFVLVGIRVPVPRTRVEQVLVNLLKNAVDAIAEVKGRAARLHIGVALEADGASVSCSVADNGCGIPADELSSIFEPYYTTKPPDRGTGLGLFVIKQIVESAGGRLEVASQVGLGATFTFRLPVAAPRDAARPALAAAAAAG